MSADGSSQATGQAEEPLFRHAPRYAGAAGQPLQNDTRYLCAAVYLDRTLCDRVIAEYLDDRHRAVVPSFGFDLRPVILHALRARRYRLIRDLTLGAIWVISYILVGLLAVALFFVFLCASLIHLIPWRRLSMGWRFVGIWALTSLGATLVPLVIGFVATISRQGTTPSGYDQVESFDLLESLRTDLAPASLLVIVLSMTVVVVAHLATVYKTLATDLRPGASDAGGSPPTERIRLLLDRIGSAQRGNVTLYSGENPFIGAGDATAPWARVWSIVLELDRPASGAFRLGARPREENTDRPGEGDAGGKQTVRVDPVVMHRRIQTRLQEMRDEWPPREDGAPGPGASEWLPPNERIAGLVTDMYVVGRGECVQRPRPLDASGGRWFDRGHPLIDPRGGVPFSVAAPAAVEAFVRHPQAGIRCYQRVTVGARGQAVTGPDGRPIAPAEDQNIALSAFVYLAVEGRMLYGQFVATVLPPIRREFRVVDVLPDWDVPTLLLRSLAGGWRSILSSALLAWPRVIRTCWRMAGSVVAADSTGNPSARMTHDYGARVSVRELAAEDGFHTFLQELDADKYTRLIERRVNEALLDYLDDECGIDVSAYRQQASVIMNEGVILAGGTVHGQVAVGKQVDQRQTGINP